MDSKRPTTEIDVEDLRPHVYDGIQEYDKRLPNWWLMTFYGAIVFSVIYWFVYYDTHIVAPDQIRVSQDFQENQALLLAGADISDATLWEMSKNPQFVNAGKETFTTLCVACHGEDLKGGLGGGVNLVDSEWLHGGRPLQIMATIVDGVPNTGMQSWLGSLSSQEIADVTAYVLSFHEAGVTAPVGETDDGGSNPAPPETAHSPTPPAGSASAEAREAEPSPETAHVELPANFEERFAMARYDPETLEAARTKFDGFCLPCHNPSNQPGSREDLADGVWHHANAPAGLYGHLVHGAQDRGMPGFGELLEEDDLINLTAYLAHRFL